MKSSVFHFSFYIFFFHFFFLGSVYSQQPGGVNGTKIFYITAAENNLKKFTFKDASGNRWASTDSSTEGRTFNFHPAIKNPNWNFLYKNLGFNQGTVVGIFYPRQTSSNDIFFNINYDTLRYTLKNAQLNKLKSGYSYGKISRRTTLEVSPPTNSENAMKTVVFYSAMSKNYLSVWGEDKKASILQNFTGYLPELISYNRVLSSIETWKIQTYLAIKYGITLDTSYLVRDGTTIWNINDTTVRQFHHRVCAIAKDSLAGLYQPKSNTSYEEGYKSYEHNSYNDGISLSNYSFIPASDSPSLYRSVTIAFNDIKPVSEGTYIIWGDNNRLVKSESTPFSYLDSLNKIETINRVWLIKTSVPTKMTLKIIIAGKSYFKNDRKNAITVFEKMYEPYDYQFYRYLLVKLNSPNTKDTARLVLNTYFGREQSKDPKAENFNTRFLVWDSVSLNQNSSLNYFTFGRVPLLSFWEAGKLKGRIYDKKIILSYVYDRNLPLNTETIFDTAITNFKNGDSLQLKLSAGVFPVRVRYKENSTGSQWKNVNDTTASASINETIENSSQTASTTPLSDSTSEKSEEIIKGNIRYLTKQPWKKDLPFEYLKLRGVKTDTTYIIEATDRLGQKSTLSLRLRSAAH